MKRFTGCIRSDGCRLWGDKKRTGMTGSYSSIFFCHDMKRASDALRDRGDLGPDTRHAFRGPDAFLPSE